MKFTNIDMIRPTSRGGSRIGAEEMRVGVSKDKKKDYPICCIVFGHAIIETLRWAAKDRLSISFNDKHILLQRIDKGGYGLSKAENNPHHRLTFPLFPPMPFTKMTGRVSSKTVEWEYFEGGILITLPKLENENG